jgi:hypothetical protein
MPEQTYNIGYGSNDFFYDKQNSEFLKTIPFSKESLLTWVQTYDKSVTSAVDVFDPKLTAVVFANKQAFIDNYLPNNIIVDSRTNFSDYKDRVINLNAPPGGVGSSYKTPIESGTVTLETSNQQAPIVNFNLISEGSDI